MNQYQLSVQAHYRPEILERILRVVRHRGFRLNAMTMGQPAEADGISLEMTVSSLRSVELLSVQLTKLMDVTSVQVK